MSMCQRQAKSHISYESAAARPFMFFGQFVNQMLTFCRNSTHLFDILNANIPLLFQFMPIILQM